MKLLITGSSGFIGGSIGRFAANAGYEVTGIARRSQPDRDWPGFHVSADVAWADLSSIIKEAQPDIIFHGAGTASVAASFSSPLDDLRAAAMTWANLLDGVRRSGLRPRVIFPSSAAVYGNPSELPVSEDAEIAPISPYGFHKAVCEMIAHEYAKCFGIDIVVCRVFSVFGPTQRRLLLWEIFEQLRNAEPSILLQGTGMESRDYLHVDDLAAGIILIAGSDIVGREREVAVFNMASGCETRIIDLANQMTRHFGSIKNVKCMSMPMSGNPGRWVANMCKTHNAIPNWAPRDISDALADCMDQWQQRTRGAGDF